MFTVSILLLSVVIPVIFCNENYSKNIIIISSIIIIIIAGELHPPPPPGVVPGMVDK